MTLDALALTQEASSESSDSGMDTSLGLCRHSGGPECPNSAYMMMKDMTDTVTRTRMRVGQGTDAPPGLWRTGIAEARLIVQTTSPPMYIGESERPPP